LISQANYRNILRIVVSLFEETVSQLSCVVRVLEVGESLKPVAAPTG
jgi:hypothetical protein